MELREKLIDLLRREPCVSPYSCNKKCKYYEEDDCHAMRYADHLIANGVEIPNTGRWITHNKGKNNWCECSECNTVGSPFWKRCPVCEAKMEVAE